jgi:tripartite-type tricarboxylate transporter receptor subunit TctC
VIDLLSSQVDLTSISAIQAAPFAASGKLKVYAIIGRKRFAGMPDVPTLGELGYKKLDIDFWHMMVAPAGTPRPIIQKLNAALRTALADASVQKSFADGGMAAYPLDEQTPEAAHELLKNEIKLWNDVINANQITAQ